MEGVFGTMSIFFKKKEKSIISEEKIDIENNEERMNSFLEYLEKEKNNLEEKYLLFQPLFLIDNKVYIYLYYYK